MQWLWPRRLYTSRVGHVLESSGRRCPCDAHISLSRSRQRSCGIQSYCILPCHLLEMGMTAGIKQGVARGTGFGRRTRGFPCSTGGGKIRLQLHLQLQYLLHLGHRSTVGRVNAASIGGSRPSDSARRRRRKPNDPLDLGAIGAMLIRTRRSFGVQERR